MWIICSVCWLLNTQNNNEKQLNVIIIFKNWWVKIDNDRIFWSITTTTWFSPWVAPQRSTGGKSRRTVVLVWSIGLLLQVVLNRPDTDIGTPLMSLITKLLLNQLTDVQTLHGLQLAQECNMSSVKMSLLLQPSLGLCCIRAFV